MKRKITDLEQRLIIDGWCLAIKRYTGKNSERTFCYEYHKLSDITKDGKSFEQVIKLDQKRSQIVDYGVRNIYLHYLNDQEMCFVRFLFYELKHYVERIEQENASVVDTLMTTAEKLNEIAQGFVPNSELDEKQELPPLTPEQFDELCQEMENENAKGS